MAVQRPVACEGSNVDPFGRGDATGTRSGSPCQGVLYYTAHTLRPVTFSDLADEEASRPTHRRFTLAPYGFLASSFILVISPLWVNYVAHDHAQDGSGADGCNEAVGVLNP